MVSINGIKNEYIIDLSESVDSKYVLSTDSNDSINISYVSNSDAIYAYIFEKNNISIEIDVLEEKQMEAGKANQRRCNYFKGLEKKYI